MGGRVAGGSTRNSGGDQAGKARVMMGETEWKEKTVTEARRGGVTEDPSVGARDNGISKYRVVGSDTEESASESA